MSERTHFQHGITQETIPDLSLTEVASILQQQALLGHTNQEQRERAIELTQQHAVKLWLFVILAGILLGFIFYYVVTQ